VALRSLQLLFDDPFEPLLDRSKDRYLMIKQRNMDWPAFWLIVFGVMSLGVITYHYLLAWEIGYSSDTALIGLMGKYILERGERPIYVWDVGYQGLILEAYSMAGFFAIFGVNPIAINFASTIYLWLALGVWTCVFSKAFGRRAAALAMVATVFSLPIFYQLNLRSLPNFPEALLLGGLLFLMFEHLRAKYEASEPIAPWKMILFGFLSGFAFYTFAITVYFMMAIAATLFVIYYRVPLGANPKALICSWSMPWGKDSSVRHQAMLLSGRWHGVLRRILGVSAGLGWLVGLSAVVICFLEPEPVMVFGLPKKWNSLRMLFGAGALVIMPRAGVEILAALRQSAVKQRMARLFSLGCLVGYSPAILFVLMGGHSSKQALASGNWSQIKLRLAVYEQFHELLLHFGDFSGWLFSLYFFGCMAAFLWMWNIGIKKYVRDSRARLPASTVFGFLFVVVFSIFIISKSVVDMASMRYLVLTVPVCALMLGVSTNWIWIHRPKFKWAAALCYLGVVGQGARSIYDDLSQPRSLPFEKIAHELEKRNLTYAYADYWLAYATNFISNEQVILEPIYSNYSPYYGPLVKAANRIGYLDYAPGRFLPKDGRIEIKNQTYKVLEESEVSSGIILRVLEKI
jgi:hypothetical protein